MTIISVELAANDLRPDRARIGARTTSGAHRIILAGGRNEHVDIAVTANLTARDCRAIADEYTALADDLETVHRQELADTAEQADAHHDFAA